MEIRANNYSFWEYSKLVEDEDQRIAILTESLNHDKEPECNNAAKALYDYYLKVGYYSEAELMVDKLKSHLNHYDEAECSIMMAKALVGQKKMEEGWKILEDFTPQNEI